ncbi:N5-carboxyaminoimidazole ribonucleotide synthase [hydrothermal vent metagenome]|uniref:N5-carboxyaminoimidazole ribonucleotide synthase n=1 Tax=hydrothermal vent metagenome TaxID=652676 RepID=A0A3B0Z0H0_9ZZZZ
MISPGAILGVLGGGQLGRMFCIAARTMGYRVWVLDPNPDSPAGALADRHLQTDYLDQDALHEIAEQCAAVTTEFENVPAETLAFLEARVPVHPGSRAVAIARDRILEKTFIREQGLATAPFFAIKQAGDLDAACADLHLPAILKTAQLGYDGKGQITIHSPEEAQAAFQQLGQTACVLEERVDLEYEVSVILARSTRGEVAAYPVGENVHVNGILDTTSVPSQLPETLTRQAIEMATRLADALDYCGVLAVELFVTKDQRLLVNEMAPRPHNSGHYTLDASVTSQFEQQVRVLCGFAPGSTALLSPVVMVNILGDLWHTDTPPWASLLQHDTVKLHLYGKKQALPGRKMGHYTCLADDTTLAMALAEHIRSQISRHNLKA